MRSMDEVYASLAYNGAPLLRVPVCVSRALLVWFINIDDLERPWTPKRGIFSRAVETL